MQKNSKAYNLTSKQIGALITAPWSYPQAKRITFGADTYLIVDEEMSTDGNNRWFRAVFFRHEDFETVYWASHPCDWEGNLEPRPFISGQELREAELVTVTKQEWRLK